MADEDAPQAKRVKLEGGGDAEMPDATPASCDAGRSSGAPADATRHTPGDGAGPAADPGAADATQVDKRFERENWLARQVREQATAAEYAVGSRPAPHRARS